MMKYVRKLFGPKCNTGMKFGRMAVRDRFKDLKIKVKTESPMIVDGGANNGAMADLFLKQYKSPRIHAFEPIPNLVDKLKVKYAPFHNVIVHDKALGSESMTVTFNVVNNIMSSSIFKPTAVNKGYHGWNMEIKETIKVRQVRLDEVLNEEIDILKLDLQGYELEALKGAERLLARIKTITAEIEFVPLYEEQPLFGDVDTFLRSKGFKLLNLYELYTHQDGQLTAGDAVYLNTRFF